MRSATVSASGNETRAVSVARLTVAATPSSLFSFFSTRVAHDAQVIPPMTRSVVLMIGSHERQRAAGSRHGCVGRVTVTVTVAVAVAGQAVGACLVEGSRDRFRGERGVTGYGDRRYPAGNQAHGHGANAVQALDLLSDGAGAM